MRDAPDQSAIVRLTRFMLDCAHDDLSLVAREQRPDASPASRASSAMPALIALASKPYASETARPPYVAMHAAAMATGLGRPAHRQPAPVTRYVAPAACVVAVLTGLVAMMATGPHQTVLAPIDAARMASSAIDRVAVFAVVQSKATRETDTVAPQRAEADDAPSKTAALPVPAEPVISQPPAVDRQTVQHFEMAQHVAPVASPIPVVRHRDAAPGRAERPAAREQMARAEAPPQQAPHGMSSIARQLAQARDALVSGDTYGARRMMKEVQTLILFEPSNAPPGRASGAVSQLTQALMMLSGGYDERALGYLNEALTAVRQVS